MNRMFAGRRTALAAALLGLLGGCVGMDVNPLGCDGPPAPGVPCQVTALWDHQIHFTADPTHGGVQVPALGGRVYLFGPEIKYPMTGDGKLQVEVYDGTAPPGAAVAPLQVWQFDPGTMQRLLKRDFVGWGYTIPLVWPDLPPTVRSVRMKVCYQPAKGCAAVFRGRVDDDRIPRPVQGSPTYTQSAKPCGSN